MNIIIMKIKLDAKCLFETRAKYLRRQINLTPT
jgi:hypothetical protein